MLSGKTAHPPPAAEKKERINLCRALCHPKSDTSRETEVEGDQHSTLQPGDGHSMQGIRGEEKLGLADWKYPKD